MKNRRKLVIALGASALTAPFASFAQKQPTKVPRIGLLSPFSSADTALWNQAFRQGLRDLGWVEGKNISIDYVYGDGKGDRLPVLTADLIRLKVDVIVAAETNAALSAQSVTKSIPIVMASVGDPVASGLVASLARPGGNITGLSQIASELVAKRLELLKEIVPTLSRVAVLWNPQGVASVLNWKGIQPPAQKLGIQLQSLEVRSAGELDKAFEGVSKGRAGALAIMPDPVFVTNLKRIADYAAKNRLPSIFHLSAFVDSGGLVAYGADRSDLFRRAATYVDNILKGAKPGDLPVEQPTKFELVINMKTAKALGIKIPNSILLRADKLIE